MLISDWSSDCCSSDLLSVVHPTLVQVITGAGRLDVRRWRMHAIEVEGHHAVFVGSDGDEVTAQPQRGAAAGQVISAQADIVPVGFHIDDHALPAPLGQPGNGGFLAPPRPGASPATGEATGGEEGR